MTILELARTVTATRSCHVFRAKPLVAPSAPRQLDAKPYFTGSKRGWIALDLFSASTLCQIHDALSPENQTKLLALHPVAAVKVAMRLALKCAH